MRLRKRSASSCEDVCKDRRLFSARLQPSNTLQYHFYLPSHILLCFPLSFHLYHVFPNHSICLSTQISLVGLSRRPGEGRYPEHINWSPGFPKARFLDPSSSPHTLHHWVPSYTHMASPTISTLMTHRSISHFDQMIQR